MLRSLLTIVAAALFFAPRGVSAQADHRLEAGAQAAFLRVNELHETDVGIAAQAGWRLTRLVAIDGEIAWFPGIQRISGSFGSQDRVLGLAGLRAGAPAGRVEVFGKLRPGFLRFVSRDSVVCIALAIYPPPLGCQLLTGHTAFALDIGGGAGVALTPSGRTHLRAEAGDLLVRYGLVAFRNGRVTDGFVSHNLMVAAGLGWHF
jgi:hypothetical protein